MKSRAAVVVCVAAAALTLTAASAQAAGPPTVITNPADDVTAHSARLNGIVEAAGNGEVTSCHFEYGENEAYSLGSVPCEPAVPYASFQQVSAKIPGLNPETTYHFRVVAANAPGSENPGGDQTFTSPAAARNPTGGFGTASEPIDVAVDNSPEPSEGSVYVAGFGNDVEKFTKEGAQANFAGLGSPTLGGFGHPITGVGVDPSNGDILVADEGDDAVTRYSAAGEPAEFTDKADPYVAGNALTGTGGGGFEPFDVSVDTAGNIYVSNHATKEVDKFDSTGHFQKSFNGGGNYPFGTGPNPTGPDALDIDSHGNVYVIANRYGDAVKFNSAGEPVPIDGVAGHTARLALGGAQSVAVDLLSGDAYVFNGNNSIVTQYDETGAALGTREFGGQASYGMAVYKATHELYIANINDGSVDISPPIGGTPLPDVGTGNAEDVTRTSATLTGITAPAGTGDITECYFEVTGQPNVPCEQPTPFAATTEVSAAMTGLTQATNYPYRLVVESEEGGLNQGQSKTLETVSAVFNVRPIPAMEVDRTSATLRGALNPDGIETFYHFEYGTTECSLGGCIALPDDGPLADEPGIAGDPVSQHVTGLKPDTTYSYRLVAHNKFGATSSTEGTFTTLKAVFGLSTDPATEVGLASATLNGALNPDGFDTHYYFKYGIDENYGQKTSLEDAGSISTSPNPSAPINGVQVSGLQPHHVYHYRIVAENTFGVSEGADRSLETPSTPTIGSFTSSNLTANSADLQATINPQGSETKYHFEFGTSPSYGTDAPVSDEPIGSATSDQSVSVHLEGLQPVTYHFRVVATNEWGTTSSGDQTFNFYPPSCPNSHVRQETGSSDLPDCRAYELVSPPNQGNVVVFPGQGPPAPYATDPARFAWGGGFGQVTGTNPPSNIQVDDYISTRTDSGWVTTFAGLRGDEVQGQGFMMGDLGFDTVIDFQSGGCLGCDTEPESLAPFVWDVSGKSLGRWPASLVTLSPTDTSTHGSWQPSPDFSHLAFSSNNVAFGPSSTGLTAAPGSAYDYETATETTTIISRTPSGSDIAQEPGNTNATEFIRYPGDGFLPFNDMAVPTQLHPSVSTDGSHILMSTAGASGGVHLYMRVNDAVTYDVSAGHDVNYVGMIADGSKVFFTSDQQLTADDTDTSTDLYMWSLNANGSDSITKLSAGNNGAGNSDTCSAAGGWTGGCSVVAIRPDYANSAGDSPIASGNGDIYFYSPEQLDGSKGLPNQENLYVYRGGQAEYVTTFSPGGYCDPEENGCSNGPVGRIDVSPDDSHMAFVTNQRMTGYDNRGFAEMYSYDPANGDIICVSCSTSGEPPVGNTEGSDNGLFMSDDGRTFFYTRDPLVAQDTDKVRDVYEYVDGRPQLITAGTGSTDSGSRGADFAGVSADGINVYFSTFDVLISQDHNGQFAKYYDARTNGGFPNPPPPAPCAAADECHGPGSSSPAPPQLASGADLGAGGNWASHRASTKHHRKRQKRKHQRRHRGLREQVRGR
jgi:hypothetical protein